LALTIALLKNAAWGGLGELAARLAKIAQVMIVVRWLGAEQYGRFNHAAAVAGMFAVLFDLGIATIAVREVARNPANRMVVLEYGALKLISSAVGLALLASWSLVTLPESGERRLVLLSGFYLWLLDFGAYVFVFYRARQEFWKETAVRLVISILQLAACVIALWLWGDVLYMTAALAVSALLALLPLGFELSRGGGTFQPVPLAHLGRRLKECLPVAGTALVATVYMNYDIIILARHATMVEVGWYSIAVKTVFGILIMPVHFFSLASLPVLSARNAEGDATELSSLWLGYFARTTFVGAALALAVGILARPLLQLAFGREFLPAAPMLLAFVLPCFFFYLYTPLTQWLLLQGKQAWSTAVSAFAALLNIVLVLWWVPLLGVWGATFAAVVTHAFLSCGSMRLVLNDTHFSGREEGWRQVIRTVLAFGLSWLVIRFAPWPPAIVGLIAAGVFLGLTFRQSSSFFVYARSLPCRARSHRAGG